MIFNTEPKLLLVYLAFIMLLLNTLKLNKSGHRYNKACLLMTLDQILGAALEPVFLAHSQFLSCWNALNCSKWSTDQPSNCPGRKRVFTVLYLQKVVKPLSEVTDVWHVSISKSPARSEIPPFMLLPVVRSCLLLPVMLHLSTQRLIADLKHDAFYIQSFTGYLSDRYSLRFVSSQRRVSLLLLSLTQSLFFLHGKSDVWLTENRHGTWGCGGIGWFTWF